MNIGLRGVNANVQNSQERFQWISVPGSFWRAQAMATDDFFHARLDSMIDLRHPLAAALPEARLQLER
jgi:hypothetical protein